MVSELYQDGNLFIFALTLVSPNDLYGALAIIWNLESSSLRSTPSHKDEDKRTLEGVARCCAIFSSWVVPSELLEWQIRILFLFSGDSWLKMSKHLFFDEVKINPLSCLCFVSISSIFLIAFCSSANELREFKNATSKNSTFLCS